MMDVLVITSNMSGAVLDAMAIVVEDMWTVSSSLDMDRFAMIMALQELAVMAIVWS
jgi:hypothetical protein